MAKSIFNNLIKSLSSNKKISSKPMTFTAQGTSGTDLYAGHFDEEYLSKLLAEQGIEVFDQMRRSDGVVKMLLSVVKNPIKSANWEINAVDESDEEQEIKEFAEYILFEDIVSKKGKRKTFVDFIGEALTCIEFGFSAFEIVHKVVRNDKKFGDYIGIADLGFRHQRSIIEWILETDGTINHIRQMVNGDLGVDTLISGKHLLNFTIEKEGDNYEGISMLRPCYGSWWRKNTYRKMQAIGIERAARGVTVGKIPAELLGRDDYEAQLAAFQAVIDKLSANQTNGIVIGAGFELEDLKLSHDAEKVQTTINGENLEMAQAFIASFLLLGTGGNSGSFALGEDQSSIFLGGIQNIGYDIAENINLKLIRPLIRAKYGDRDKYPELAVSGIADKVGKDFAEMINKLVTVGAVQKSPALQRHIHSKLDLPDIDEEMAEEDSSPEEGDDNPKAPNPPKKKKDTVSEDKANKEAEAEEKQKKKLSDSPCDCSIRLTEEERENAPISAYIEDKADELTKIMRKGLTLRSDEMLDTMSKIIRKGGDESKVRKAVTKIPMPDSKEYDEALRKFASDMVDEVLENTLDELDLKKRGFKFAAKDELSKLAKNLREKLIQLLMLTADYQDIDYEKAVYFTFNEEYGRIDDEDVIDAMDEAVARQLDKKVIETAAVNTAAKITNNVRENVFFAPEVINQVESFVFTNPAPVSAICQSLNGRVFSKEEYQSSGNIPPLHHNCKSYVVPQMVGVEGNTGLTSGGLKVTDPDILKTKTL